jgi:hypothetical protein
MLNFLQSIFGSGEKRGRYPESLIEMATERAVEGTDPRLRALSGYARQLRQPVIQAIDHVITLVDGLPEPLLATPANQGTDPRLAVMFASAEDMLQKFAGNSALTDYLESPEGRGVASVTALLVAERVERNILGLDLVGDQVRRDVAQVAVNFTGQRLLEPNANETENRRLLKRRAFDVLLAQALARINEFTAERSELTRQRDLLQRKLGALRQGGWGFGPSAETRPPDQARLTADLEAISAQLQALGPDQEVLQGHLRMVTEVLEDAEHQLWIEPITLVMDAMNIQRAEGDAAARNIALLELHDGRGQRAILLPVTLLPDQLPVREDFLTAVARYL